jgi:septal ring factor EnvC (AmiA/AmiB activator)
MPLIMVPILFTSILGHVSVTASCQHPVSACVSPTASTGVCATLVCVFECTLQASRPDKPACDTLQFKRELIEEKERSSAMSSRNSQLEGDNTHLRIESQRSTTEAEALRRQTDSLKQQLRELTEQHDAQEEAWEQQKEQLQVWTCCFRMGAAQSAPDCT